MATKDTTSAANRASSLRTPPLGEMAPQTDVLPIECERVRDLYPEAKEETLSSISTEAEFLAASSE